MNNVINTMQGHPQAITITYISQKEADTLIITKALFHFVLLKLVARENDDSARASGCQETLKEGFSEGTSATGYEHGGTIKNRH